MADSITSLSPEAARAATAVAKRFYNPIAKAMIEKQSVLVAQMEIAISNARRHLELAEQQLQASKVHLGELILQVDQSERAPMEGAKP